MLSYPPERNVNPFLFRARLRTLQKLVVALAIHDKDVTMAKEAQVFRTVRRGLAPPFEKCLGTKTYRDDKLWLSTPAKQRLIVAVPPNTSLPSLIKVQVGRVWHFSLQAPRAHQGCDFPPHLSKQWPTPLASLWPNCRTVSIRA